MPGALKVHTGGGGVSNLNDWEPGGAAVGEEIGEFQEWKDDPEVTTRVGRRHQCSQGFGS